MKNNIWSPLYTGAALSRQQKYVSNCRVKSGIFGQTAKFGQRPCLFHISKIGIKNKSTKQTVKILMRRLIRSHPSGFTLFANVCPNLPDV